MYRNSVGRILTRHVGCVQLCHRHIHIKLEVSSGEQLFWKMDISGLILPTLKSVANYLNTYTCIDNHLNAGGGGKMSVHSSNCLAPIAGLQLLLDNHKDLDYHDG